MQDCAPWLSLFMALIAGLTDMESYALFLAATQADAQTRPSAGQGRFHAGPSYT